MDGDPFEKLTPRQKACLRLVRDGRSTKEIADALDASVSAVDKSIKLAMAKIGVNRRPEAARLLAAHEARNGYQPLDPQLPDLPNNRPDPPLPLPTATAHRGTEASSVREAERPYRIDVSPNLSWQQDAPWPSGADHKLGAWQIIVRVMLVALASMLLAGAALNLVRSTGLIPEGLFPQR